MRSLLTLGTLLVLLAPGTVAEEPGTASCFGVDCPFGNDDPGAGCANSTGAGALLGGTGSTSVAADDLVLTCSQLPPNKFGTIFRGRFLLEEPFLFGQGKLCAGPPYWRTHVFNTGDSGILTSGPGIVAESLSVGFELVHIQAGDSWTFQCWYRDVPVPGIPFSFNTSNAYTVTFTP